MIFSIRNVVLKSISFALLFLTLSSAYAGLFESRHLQGEVGASGVIYTDKKGESLPIWVKSRWQDEKRVEVAVFPNIQQSIKNPAYTEQAIVVKRYIDIFNHWKTQNPDLATTGRFLLRKDISNTTFALVNKNMDAAVAGDVVLNAISPNTKLIFARGQSQTTQPTPEHIVLLEFPVTIVATLNEEPRQGEINANPNGYKILVQGENDLSYLYGSDGILEEDGIATFSASKNGKVLSLADIATLDPTDAANQTVFTAIESFSYRTAYFKKDGLNLESETAINIADRRYYHGNASEPLLFPVKQAPISIAGNQEGAIYGGWDLTNDQGRFSVNYIIPYCFGVFDVPTPIQTQLNYASFNPNGSNNLHYTLTYPHRTTCLRSFSVAPHPLSPSIVAVNEHTDDAYDFIMINVDFNVFAGKASFTNKNITSTSNSSTVVSADTDTKRIKIEDTTIYTATAPKVQDINTLTIPDYFDFNGDGKADTIKPGRLKTLKIITGIDADGSSILEDKTVFVVHTDSTNLNPNPNTDTTATIDNPIYYGVYISDNKTTYTLDNGDTSDAQPDFIRLADIALNTAANGLLTQISKSAARNTDVMIFRESTGELLLHFHGLDNGVDATGALGLGVDADTETLGYTARIRGGLDKKGEGTTEQYSNAVKKQRINTSLYKRTGNHLRPGERVQIILKNRSTGYMGMATKTIQSFGTSAQQQADDIELKPPQLKIWAQRLTANEATTTLGNLTSEKNYLIGHEGAGLDSDDQIILYTEWLGPEGQPLPAGLSSNEGKDFGYTGFLTRINNGGKLEDATNNAEDLSGSTAAQFAIRPGLQMQLIRLSNDIKNNQHFYVYVSGKAMAEEHCTPGSEQELASLCYDVKQTHNIDNEDGNTNILQGRPLYYTPLLTPRYDEEGYWQDLKAFRDGRTSTDNATDLIKPKASYAWGYRPEYQFSLLSLQMDQIKRTYTDANDADQTVTLFDINANNNTKNPTLSSSDSLLEILYSLSDDAENSSPLPSLDLPMGQELVFALGEHEIHATAGANQTIKFDNFDHLGLLEVEDFLSVRLYLNHDAANLLWEYAFEHAVLTPNPEGVKEIVITADEAELAFNLMYLGYYSRPEEEQEIRRVSWEVNGNLGWFDPPIQAAKEGSFSNTLYTTNIAGSEGYFIAYTSDLNSTSPPQAIRSPKIRIIAGKPDSMSVSTSGSTAIGGIDTLTMEVSVKDFLPQKVEDDTSVSITHNGDIELDYDGSTIDGKVIAKIKGGNTAGLVDITIQAGTITETRQIMVDDVQLSIVMPAVIKPKTKEIISIHATSVGHDLNGKVITLRSTKGDLKNYDVTIQDGAATTIIATDSRAGSGLLTATFEDNVFAKQSFTIGYPSARVAINEPVLVADKPINGSATIVDGEGGTFEAPYVISTEMALIGTVGETQKVSIGSIANPPIEPLLFYTLNNVYGDNHVGDAYGIINGKSENVQRNPESAEGFKGAFSFDQTAKVSVPYNKALKKKTNIGFGIQVKPSSEGTIVDYDLTSQKLSLTSDNRFHYQITTDTGSYSVQSEPVVLEEWHTIGVRYKDDEITLEVGEDKYSTVATGNLIIVTPPEDNTVITLGNSFSGDLNKFKVVDWDYPLLATLPNGDIEMDVIFATETETVAITSTGLMGTRAMGYSVVSGYDPIFFPEAYANDTLNRWMGEVTFQGKAVSYALVESAKWSADAATGFAKGLLLGDGSSTAGFIGDIALGFIPFGDSRDIALQEWNYAYDNAKYDEVILYLAYIGLGADALMLSGVGTAVGIPLNAAIAVIKPTMKKIKNFPMKKVLGKKFKEMGEAAKNRDWTRFESVATGMIPFLQLFAAVAFDDDLRNLLVSAIRNTTDLDNWAKYIKGYADQPDVVAYNSPLPQEMFDEAHASQVSNFKLILREFLSWSIARGVAKPAEKLSDSIAEFNKSIESGWETAAQAYNGKAIKALVNVSQLGGVRLVRVLSDFNTSKHGRRVEEFMTDLSEINVSALSIQSKEGMRKVIGNMSHPLQNMAKGSAHHIHVIAYFQKIGRTIKNVELKETVVIAGKSLQNRIYDAVVDIGGVLTRIEAKSWIPNNIKDNTKAYLLGKAVKNSDGVLEHTDEGAQLLMDLMSYAEKNYTGHKWVFDKDMAGNESIFKSEIFENLRENTELQKRLMGYLGKNKRQLKTWIDDLESNLGDFVEVVL